MSNKLTSLKGFGEGDPKPEKKERHLHVVGMGHGRVKGPENMKRNPVLSPKSSALHKKMGKKDSPVHKAFGGVGLESPGIQAMNANRRKGKKRPDVWKYGD